MAGAAFVTDLTEILTQAAEAAAGIASIVQGYKNLELAEDYYDLYKQQRDFYLDTFYNGVEVPLANEVYVEPIPVLDYAARIATAYDPVTGPFGGRSTDAAAWWARHAATYSTNIDAKLQRQLTADLLRVKSDWTNYMFRFEEVYFDLRVDIRNRKRLGLHNIGMKQGVNVSSAMDTALGEYQSHIQDFGSQLATYGNGIAKYAGYKRGLADVEEQYDAMSYKIAPQAATYTTNLATSTTSAYVSNMGTGPE